LPPFFCNVAKRLTNSPKLDRRDTGLLHHLLNFTTLAHLDRHPTRLTHPHAQFSSWRTAGGTEADLVVERGSTRFAIEVKTGRGDRPRAIRALEQATADIEARGAWIVDQDEGVERVRSTIERRGMQESLAWLPA